MPAPLAAVREEAENTWLAGPAGRLFDSRSQAALGVGVGVNCGPPGTGEMFWIFNGSVIPLPSLEVGRR